MPSTPNKHPGENYKIVIYGIVHEWLPRRLYHNRYSWMFNNSHYCTFVYILYNIISECMSIESTYSIQQHLKYHCNIRKAILRTPRFVSKVEPHSKQLYYCLVAIQHSLGKATSGWNHSHHQQNATIESMKKLVPCPKKNTTNVCIVYSIIIVTKYIGISTN